MAAWDVNNDVADINMRLISPYSSPQILYRSSESLVNVVVGGWSHLIGGVESREEEVNKQYKTLQHY